MATRTKKPRKAAKKAAEIQRVSEPLAFLAEQPRSFAYVEDEDEFEIPQIPTEFARSGREVRFSMAMRPASSFDLIGAN